MQVRLSIAIALVLVAGPVNAQAVKPHASSARKTAPVPAPARAAAPGLVLFERAERPKVDYEAEVYSGVPLDDPYAKERGLDKGLVLMVFEKQRRIAFRLPRERIKTRVRFVPASTAAARVPAPSPVRIAFAPAAFLPAPAPRDHVDVLFTDDAVFVVDTTSSTAGIFTSSDVYAFPLGTTFEQRIARLGAVPPPARERVRQALSLAR